MDMDGTFEYEGRTISFKITDNVHEGIRVVRGVEKMNRYFNFYDSKGTFIDVIAKHGDAEEMTNITSEMALESYIELITKK